MKAIHCIALSILLSLSACATTEQGPDETQKTRLAETASAWAEAFNQRKWDELPDFYSKEIDFNGKPMLGGSAVSTMKRFMEDDFGFRVQFEAESWDLDSMRGNLYAGHLDGVARYNSMDDTLIIQIDFWMRMADTDAPLIVAQFDHIGEAYNTLQRRYHDQVMAGQDFDPTGRPNYYFWEELQKGVSPLLGQLKYFSKHEGRRLFYALDKDGSGKMGIADEKGKTVIPYKYDDIGGIGVILDRVVEVKQGTQKGLLRMDGSELLAVAYDAILPIFDDPQRAFWAYRDGAWATYNSDGQPVIPEGGRGDGSGPDWVRYLQELPLDDLWKPGHPAFVGEPLGAFEGDDDQEWLEDYGVLRVPFALAERNVLQDMNQGGMDLEYAAFYTIDSVFVSGDGRVQMISKMETWGIGGRESYHDLDTRWVVFEPELRDTAQLMPLYSINLDESAACHTGGMRVLGDTLIETSEGGYLLGYWSMPLYHYFRIQPDGELAVALPGREFPFMSLVAIDHSFLEGCFRGEADEQETIEFKQNSTEKVEDYMHVLRVAKHFRASDLDYMVNEVYAAHGYKFSKPKWQEYFAEKSWYKPVSDDVDAELSALEKQNIALLRSVQSEMKNKERAFTRPDFAWHYEP